MYTYSRQGFHPYTTLIRFSIVTIYSAILVSHVAFLGIKLAVTVHAIIFRRHACVLICSAVARLHRVPYVVHSMLN